MGVKSGKQKRQREGEGDLKTFEMSEENDRSLYRFVVPS